MSAIPYESPQEDWEGYEDETDEPLPGRPRRQFLNRWSALLIVVIVGALCFYAGVRVEKGQVSSSPTTALSPATGAGAGAAGASARASAAGATSRGGAASLLRAGGGGGAVGANASFGTVSSVSGHTLYVNKSSGNSLKVELSSATKITKSVSVSKSAVRPGDTVIIRGLNSNGTLSATSVSDSGAGAAGFGFGAGGLGSGTSGSGAASAGGAGSSGSGGANSAVNSLFGSGGGG